MLPRLPRTRKEKSSLPLMKKRGNKPISKALIRLPSLKPSLKAEPALTQQETADSDDNSTDNDDDSTPNTTIVVKRSIINTKPMKNARRHRRQSVINKIVHHMVMHSTEHQRIEGADEKLKLWLAVISMMSRLAYFYILSKPCALNTPQALTKMENRRKAARFIIRFLKHKSNWFHRRILKRFTFLHKHGWRLRLYCRCFLRRKAVVLVRTFFHDFASFRLPYIMMKYRTNAIHLQRFVRSYVVITQARIATLLLKWQQLESTMRMTLIPNLLLAAEKEYECKQRVAQSDEGMKWKKVKIDGVVLPQLAENVNRATKATIKLKHTMDEGGKRLRSYQLPALDATASVSSPPKSNMIRKQEKVEIGMKSSHSEGSLALQKKKKEIAVSSAMHSAPFRYLKKHPHDIGLKTSIPSNQKAKEKLIASYLYDCRFMFKKNEHEKRVQVATKKKQGLTVEEVKSLLNNDTLLNQYEEILSCSSTEAGIGFYSKFSLLIYTGDNFNIFRTLVENDLRREYGLPLI